MTCTHNPYPHPMESQVACYNFYATMAYKVNEC